MCPLRGEAYHQLSGWPAWIWPSDVKVENRSTLSGDISFLRLAINAQTSGTCSNTSKAVIRSNLPSVSILRSLSTKGSYEVDGQSISRNSLDKAPLPPP